jgi:hypothetical protein
LLASTLPQKGVGEAAETLGFAQVAFFDFSIINCRSKSRRKNIVLFIHDTVRT